MIPGNANPLLLASAAEAAAAGVATKSLRFNRADSASLTRNPSSASNRKTWTWAAWVKMQPASISGGLNLLWSASASGSDQDALYTESATDRLTLYLANTDPGGSNFIVFQTTRVFRDPSAFYHLVLQYDSAASSNYVKLWVNGVEETAFETDNRNSSTLADHQAAWNSTGEHRIGKSHGSGYLNGLMADIYFIDGSAIDATSFGAFDDNGVWQAAAYSGTFGTNGFHLDFADGSDLGADNSGNGNDFTANNLSAEADFYATAGTFNGKDGISFNGTNAEITLTSDSDLNPGSGVFTLECYAYALSGGQAAFGIYDGSPGGNGSFVLRRVGAGTLMVERHSVAFDITGAAFSENAWHHVAVTRDSSNNVRLFVDGTQSGSTSTNNTHNYQGTFRLGRDNNAFTNGYISNLRLIKGTCLYTSNFTAPTGNLTNVTNTKLLMAQSTTSPIAATVKPSGVTISGSGDGSVIDVLFDVPTNGDQSDTGAGGEVSGNYCTINPLSIPSQSVTLSNGNLDHTGAGTNVARVGTIAIPSSGKWYWEITCNSGGSGAWLLGINGDTMSQALRLLYVSDARKYTDAGGGFSSYGASYTVGDVIGVAVDMDADTLTFYKNGSTQGTAFTSISSGYTNIFPYFQTEQSGRGLSVNFGQRAWAYSAPSNHKALCTTNLATPTIADGSDYFDTKLWTGDGNTGRDITGYSFSPDFVWIKQRSATRAHALFDTVRGANKRLRSDDTTAEVTSTNQLSAFLSNGFTIDDNNTVNVSSGTYVGWAWDAGSSTVSNTDGSITTSVRANQTAGFSIATYSYDNSLGSQTLGHGLGAIPDLVIRKDRNLNEDWSVYSKAIGFTQRGHLNLTSAWGGTSTFGSASATSTVNRANNMNNGNYVDYSFVSIPGFSSFGTYEGTGSASTAAFVYTGMRPRWIMVKNVDTGDSSTDWFIYDTVISTFNAVDDQLYPNRTIAEAASSTHAFDILSNGFRVRSTSTSGLSNKSGDTYIYVAFSENAFSLNGGLAR